MIKRYAGTGVLVNLGYREEDCRKWEKWNFPLFSNNLDYMMPEKTVKLKKDVIVRPPVREEPLADVPELKRMGEMVCQTKRDGSQWYGVIIRTDKDREGREVVWAVWEKSLEEAADTFEEVLDWLEATPHGLHGLETKKEFESIASRMLDVGFNLDWVRETRPLSECDIKPPPPSPRPITCPKCGRSDRILVCPGRVGKWVAEDRSYGKYKCLRCKTAFDEPDEEIKSAPKHIRLSGRGDKRYLRVGGLKIVYLDRDFEINIPQMILYSISSAVFLGVVWGMIARWQVGEYVKRTAEMLGIPTKKP